MSAADLNNQLTPSNGVSPGKFQGLDNASIRTIEEVKGAIMIAKMCPRDEDLAIDKILKACNRQFLAESALYEFPRGDTSVEGPSIRLAEAVALNWGNMQYGIRELESDETETKYEAYAWDVENNNRVNKVFSAKHGRFKKSGGYTKVEDPRDVYEVVAAHAQRRVRACIISVIPGHVMDEAVDAVKRTLFRLAGEAPKEERTKNMLTSFAEFGVSQVMIEKKFGCKIEALSEGHLVKLRAMMMGFKDGFAKPENVFEFAIDPSSKTTGAAALNAKLS